MARPKPKRSGFAICVKNEGYEVSLNRRKIYEVLADTDAATHRKVQVTDESSEDYLFPGGLHPVSSAKSLRTQTNGEVLITDGPYLDSTEHVSGFWVLPTADLNEALM